MKSILKKFNKKANYILGVIFLLLFSAIISTSNILKNQTNTDIHTRDLPISSNPDSQYIREITFSPATPEPDYQVKINLDPLNFDYSNALTNGEDIRFCDLNNNELKYWIEEWNTTDTSTIWVKVPTAGTSKIYIKYGDLMATSESNGTNVFILFDDFDGTNLDTSLWNTDVGGYGSITVSGGEVRILSDAPGSWYQTADFGFHSAYVSHGQPFGYHNTVPGAIFKPSEDIWVTGDFRWEEPSFAAYYENDILFSNDSDITESTNPVRFMAHTGYPGPGTHFGAYISSVNDTIGQTGRALRLRSWYDITGPSDIKLDWTAVRKCSDDDPISNIGPELLFGWKYIKTVTLSPSTPESDYQVRVDLNPSNFDYSKAMTNGEDIRFRDLNSNELNYWIEEWNNTGNSIIWVKVPTSGTSKIYMIYGNPFAFSESNGTNVFILFDDFDGTNLDTSLWNTDVGGYGSITVSGGEVRILSDAPGSWYQTADFGFHSAYVSHGQPFGYHNTVPGAIFKPSEDIWVTGDFRWEEPSFAAYYENDILFSNDSDITESTNPVRFMAHTGYPGPGTHFGAYISSVNDTIGQTGRALRLRSWHDITGPSDIKLDWIAVRKWSEMDPISNVQSEFMISIPPEVTINSPIPDEFFGSVAPDFEISIAKPFINEVWYTIDDGLTNIKITSFTGTINQTRWDEILTTQVTIKFYANDIWAYEGYTEVMVNKDVDAPNSLISFIPYKAPNIVNESTSFSIFANDGDGSGVSMIRYKINDSTWIVYTGSFDLSGYDTGDYLISYYSIDELGNNELENTSLVKLEEVLSTEPSPEIPGFNTLLLVGLLCLVSGILIKRYKK